MNKNKHVKRGRGRPKGSKNKPKTEISNVKITKGKRGRPKGSKIIDGKLVRAEDRTENRTEPVVSKQESSVQNLETNYIELIKENQITISKTGTELEPFPVFTKYKQAKRQLKLIDAWLLRQGLNEAHARNDDFVLGQFSQMGIDNMSPADKDSLNEYIWGINDKGQTLVRKKRGKIKVSTEKTSTENSNKDKVETIASTKSTESVPTESVPTESVPTESVPTESVPTESVPTESVEPLKRKRGRPPKKKDDLLAIATVSNEDVKVSKIKLYKHLGYCPDDCNAILGSNDQIGPRKVLCYRCQKKIWIKDLLVESTRERPSSEKEYMEPAVSLDFCSDMIVPIKPSKPLFTSDVVKELTEMSKDNGESLE